MANPKHLLKLKEGVEVWNTWRKGNPYIIPDLRWANLSRADLRRVRNINVKQLSKEVRLNGAELDSDLMEKLKRLYPHLCENLKAKKRKRPTQRCPHFIGAIK